MANVKGTVVATLVDAMLSHCAKLTQMNSGDNQKSNSTPTLLMNE